MLERAQELRDEAQGLRNKAQEELNKVIQLLRHADGKTLQITTETSTRHYTKRIPVGMAMGGGFIACEEWEVKETTTSILAGDVVIHKTTSTSERMVKTSR